MQPLSGLDASFLYLETPSQVLHICGLLTLDGSTMPGGYRFATFREKLAERVADIPEFRRKLHNSPLNLVHPVWVEDESFDIDRHLHRVAVPSPGDRETLAELCAHFAGQPLDRARPLWEMYVIEGLPGDGVAVLLKMHHATVDGVSGANLIAYLCGVDPGSLLPLPDTEDNPSPPSHLDLLRSSVTSLARRPIELAKLLPDLVGMAPRWLGRALKRTGMPVPFTAPRTSFNSTITGLRTVAYASLDLDEVKTVKNAFGVTVNDVVLALCSGALRRYLRSRGELPDEPLVATVPVSVQDRTENDMGSNQVSAFFASLPTQLADPAARLYAIAESNRVAKDHHFSIKPDMLQDWAQFAAPRLFGLAVRAYSALRLAEKHPVVHNLVISNVPGPPMPLYMLGAKVTGLYPLGPVFHGAGLNVTVISNAGRVDVGLLGARELVPELWTLADALGSEMKDLLEAADGVA
ncbi:wax ester/triacylglycerol synthase family O-acyltransferase [Amycolatopsis acidiphila]|uniref:Diacylglycerol O-acyltransferase n=1 Tax=Amycolatopsis acidiphila TaxID=715473 RepID=A0A558AEW7_9PSEU|nr:wax ester/triacylglycerol synthase family O-acyltransferase [Amycolatopsis acidiphila]TVT22801.1 wax ester/triacylglycerol synthase family O-acyltransferase [Amycolatopsis acidiphila]UIJ58186.1 wax ester/triacylglycerol synthase family O-acyltransferase [Amycolatopsis acidiphila]GHG69557.1 diacylglycerol O-acyltransferase [Amycolatopsis acidiphila]